MTGRRRSPASSPLGARQGYDPMLRVYRPVGFAEPQYAELAAVQRMVTMLLREAGIKTAYPVQCEQY